MSPTQKRSFSGCGAWMKEDELVFEFAPPQVLVRGFGALSRPRSWSRVGDKKHQRVRE